MRNGCREEAEDVEEMKEKSPIRSLKSFQIAFHNEKLLWDDWQKSHSYDVAGHIRKYETIAIIIIIQQQQQQDRKILAQHQKIFITVINLFELSLVRSLTGQKQKKQNRATTIIIDINDDDDDDGGGGDGGGEDHYRHPTYQSTTKKGVKTTTQTVVAGNKDENASSF